jgi:gliding motility-associated-like protein
MEDTTPPVFTVPASISISCELDPTDLTLTGDVLDELDNCSATIGQAIYTDSLSLDLHCDGLQIIYRIWSLSDDCGNESTAIQVITMEDVTPPAFMAPEDLTLSCDDNPFDLTLTGQVVALADNCSSGVLNNLYQDSIVVSDVCAHNVIIYRFWSVEDACGNDSTLVQIINMQDNTPPVFTAPQDISLQCGEDPDNLLITGQVEILADNCDANLPEATHSDQIINNNICEGGIVINRTWVLSDACGNSSSAIQQITISDTIPPLFSAPNNITIDCDQDPNDLTITGAPFMVSDNCDQNIGIPTYTDEFSMLGLCTGSATIRRTWSLSDACGNITTAIQIIYLEDTTPPVFTVPADLTLACDQNPFDLSLTGDVLDESDNCTSNIGQAVYKDSILVDSATCLQSMAILRTWVLVDGCGNGTTAVQQIFVEDSTAPVFLDVPGDTTIQCADLIPPLYALNTLPDNCGAATAVVSNETINGNGCNYTVTRSWLATDACGNATTATQLITVSDTIAPILNAPLPIIDIACGEAFPTPENLLATDNCTTVSVVFSIDPYVVDLCQSYQVTYRWVASDFCGNSSEVTQTFNVNCLPTDQEVLYAGICQGESFIVGNNTYTSTGVFVTNFQSIHGCDSIVTLNLTVHSPVTQMLFAEICQGESYSVGSAIYTSTGVFETTLEGINGCDSIVTLDLTVHPLYAESLTAEICQGEIYTVGGETYASTGVFITDLQSIHGCDSIVTLNLTVHPLYSESLTAEICQGETFVWNGNDYTQSGTYLTNFESIHGCDSIVSLNLTVQAPYEISVTTEVCEGEGLLLGGTMYYEPGIYVDSMQTTSGCDSVHIVTLNIISVETLMEQVRICAGDSYLFLGISYTQAGTYSASWVGASGCENMSTLVLTVEDPISTATAATICSGETYLFGGEMLTVGGEYTEHFETAGGCDSLVVLQLSIEEALFTNQQINICQGDSILLGGSYQYETGVFVNTYPAYNSNCDSIVETHLVVAPHITETEIYSICEGDSMYLFNAYYNTDTMLSITYDSYTGCDSIVIKLLEVLPEVELLVNDYEICAGESVQLSVSGATEVVWSPANSLSCVDCPMPIARPSYTTTYVVTAEGCLGEEVSAEVLVTVHQAPTISIITREEEGVVEGDSILFIATSNDPAAIISWSDSDGNHICSDCPEMSLVPYYGVTYIATAINEEGCEVSDEIRFNIRNGCVEGELEVPNFITPNGDGHNDVFEIRYNHLAELSILRIYNRWGELVFQTKSVNSDFWDGTFRGRPLNPDVYIYYFEGKCLDGNKIIEKGNITILK